MKILTRSSVVTLANGLLRPSHFLAPRVRLRTLNLAPKPNLLHTRRKFHVTITLPHTRPDQYQPPPGFQADKRLTTQILNVGWGFHVRVPQPGNIGEKRCTFAG